MRGAIATSVGLHGALLMIAYFGVPSLFQPAKVANLPIPVELVTIAEETTPLPPKVKPEPQEPEPPTPEPQPAVNTPPPAAEVEVAAVAPAESEPEPAPDPIAEEPEPAPEPKTKPEIAEPTPAPKAKPVASSPAPAPRRKPERRPKFDADRIAALLDKSAEEPPQARIEPEVAPAPEEAQAELPDLAARVRSRMTISPIDVIRRQFRSCWSFPGGARDPEGLIVTVRIHLKPDGSLSGEPQVVESERLREPNFRTAAEAAVRAVHKCAPLQQLPPLDYNEWREIKLTFDPRDLVGG